MRTLAAIIKHRATERAIHLLLVELFHSPRLGSAILIQAEANEPRKFSCRAPAAERLQGCNRIRRRRVASHSNHDASLSSFEIPGWCVRLVVILLLLGFPIAIILAWAYELTPDGIKRTEDVAPNPAIERAAGRKLNSLIIGVLLCAIAFLIYQRFQGGKGIRGLGRALASIAVLPFDNFSDEKENAFLPMEFRMTF